MRRLALLTGLIGAVAAFPAGAQMFGKTPKMDPVAYDTIQLYTRVCVSTRGDSTRIVSIMGEKNDATVEKMDEKLVLALQNDQPGGRGWTVRMPLGETLLVETAPNDTCVVRAPRVNANALDAAFVGLIDQLGSSGQFKAKRVSDDRKTLNKRAYHFMTYHLNLPDTGETAELGLATTEAKDTSVQATMTYVILRELPQ